MQTVLEILNKTTEFFAKKGVPDARLDAQYIMAHGLNMKRMDLYLNFDKPLSEGDLEVLRPLVARRANREPLQHILGSTSFRGWETKCDKRALIPRPETEVLVDLALKLIPEHGEFRVLDIGTGTGAIAIAIAKERPECKITALDISADALALASENVVAHQLGGQIELVHKDATALNSFEFDLVVSNPPYIETAIIATLQTEVKDFDPHLALDGGDDGLQIVRNLLNKMLAFGYKGDILMELGELQPQILQQEYKNQFSEVRKTVEISVDLAEVKRFLKIKQK